MNKLRRSGISIVVVMVMAITAIFSVSVGVHGVDKTAPAPQPMAGLNTVSDTGLLQYLGSYSTGTTSEDGGVAEIVKYNPDNQKMYIVSGVFQSVDIVSLKDVKEGRTNSFSLEKRIDIGSLASAHGFTSSDITSIDVNPVKDLIAISVQGADYTDNGSIVLLDYDGNYIAHTEAGVQPDMVVFTKDGSYVLSANEGEPRMGYVEGTVDPMGSVTLVKLGGSIESTKTIDFTSFDGSRQALVDGGVLLKPGTAPSVDLEPEYIAVAEDGKTAYVSLQEANAIATLDMGSGQVTSINGLGFKDHSLPGNELDFNVDSTVKLQNEDVMGIYLPDGIATVNIAGSQYVLTANEGDGREWGEYADIDSAKINGTEKKVEFKLPSEYDGLNEGTTYLLGGRSFSIWDAATMNQVFDSGSDFERITGEIFPLNFNAHHKSPDMEGRSNKKGPEPEDIQTLTIDGKVYAFIGLERIGGVMMYDISSPQSASYVDYINIRDFSTPDLDNGSDLGAEGISVIAAKDSPTGKAMVLVANEVSGTVTVLQVNIDETVASPSEVFHQEAIERTLEGYKVEAYDLFFTVGEERQTIKEERTVTVNLKSLDLDKLEIFHQLDDGSFESITQFTVDKGKETVTFSNDDFSPYLFANKLDGESGAQGTEVKSGTVSGGGSPGTGDQFPVELLIFLLLTAAGTTVAMGIKREKGIASGKSK